MRSTSVTSLVILSGFLFGCGGKGEPTGSSGSSTPMTQPPSTPSAPTGGGASGPAPSDDGGKMKVEIVKGKLSVNGTALPLPAEVGVIEKAFGKPSSTSDSGVMRALYWRDSGIKCLQDKYGDKRVTVVGFYLEGFSNLNENYTSKPFSGTIQLDGHPANKDTVLDDLGKKIGVTKNKSNKFQWDIEYEDKTFIALKEGTRGVGEVLVEKSR
jgi:hypothetical protein